MKIHRNTTIAAMLIMLLVCAAHLGCDCGDDDDDDSGDDDTTPVNDDVDDDADDDADDDIDDDVDDDVDDDTAPECDWISHDPLIIEGKALLGAYDPEGGYDKFIRALEICPDSADAMYGIMLSDVQLYLTWLNDWIGFFAGFDPSPHRGEEKSIGTVIQTLIRHYMMPINEEIFTYGEILLSRPSEARFFLDEFPMWYDEDHVLIEMPGEWDAADVHDLVAFAHFMEGLEQLLISFDFTFNYNTYSDWPLPGEGATIEETIHSYSGLILELLADPDYPDFLNFLSDGQEHLTESGVNFGFGFMGMIEAFSAALLEIDNQEDDVLGYIDANGNGHWDEGEMYRVPYLGDLAPEMNGVVLDLLALLENLGGAFLDGGPEDLRPLRPDWFLLSKLNFIMEIADLAWYEFIGHPIRFLDIPIPIGFLFYDPFDDGLRTSAGTIAQVLYDATAP